MRIMWVIRPAEGGMLSHISQLLVGLADQEILIAAPRSLEDLAKGRRFSCGNRRWLEPES